MYANNWGVGAERKVSASFQWSQRQVKRQWAQIGCRRFPLNTRKHSGTVCVPEHWHRLPLEAVDSCPRRCPKAILTWLRACGPALGGLAGAEVEPSVPREPSQPRLLWDSSKEKRIRNYFWDELPYEVLSRRSYFALWEIHLQNVSGKSCQLWIIYCPKKWEEKQE